MKLRTEVSAASRPPLWPPTPSATAATIPWSAPGPSGPEALAT